MNAQAEDVERQVDLRQIQERIYRLSEDVREAGNRRLVRTPDQTSLRYVQDLLSQAFDHARGLRARGREDE